MNFGFQWVQLGKQRLKLGGTFGWSGRKAGEHRLSRNLFKLFVWAQLPHHERHCSSLQLRCVYISLMYFVLVSL